MWAMSPLTRLNPFLRGASRERWDRIFTWFAGIDNYAVTRDRCLCSWHTAEQIWYSFLWNKMQHNPLLFTGFWVNFLFYSHSDIHVWYHYVRTYSSFRCSPSKGSLVALCCRYAWHIQLRLDVFFRTEYAFLLLPRSDFHLFPGASLGVRLGLDMVHKL